MLTTIVKLEPNANLPCSLEKGALGLSAYGSMIRYNFRDGLGKLYRVIINCRSLQAVQEAIPSHRPTCSDPKRIFLQEAEAAAVALCCRHGL